MVPLQNFATGVLAEVIRRQPPSPARTTFAWTIAVGPALARSATATLTASVLHRPRRAMRAGPRRSSGSRRRSCRACSTCSGATSVVRIEIA